MAAAATALSTRIGVATAADATAVSRRLLLFGMFSFFFKFPLSCFCAAVGSAGSEYTADAVIAQE